jgi:predicted enzyme related to lactoylglutathione lyase
MVDFKAIAPQFAVPDVIKAAEYYRDVLGFEILGYFLDPPVYAIVRHQEVQIHFGKSDTKPVSNANKRDAGLNAYIWVDDVDTLAQELTVRGANIVDGPVDRVYGRREIVVSDCFGYHLAFGA